MVFSSPNMDIELVGPDAGGAYSFNADAEVLAGQVVALTSDNGVSPSATDGEQCVGVATQSKSAGEQVQVAGPGTRVRFTAGGAVTAGALLVSHGTTGDDGTVIDADETDTVDDNPIGQAFEAAAAGETLVGMVAVGGAVN